MPLPSNELNQQPSEMMRTMVATGQASNTDCQFQPGFTTSVALYKLVKNYYQEEATIMAFIIQSVILCLVFSLLLLGGMRNFQKDPLRAILNYPPAVRERVEALPQYQGRIPQARTRHWLVKIIVSFITSALLAAVVWFSGKRTFLPAFLHTFGLFLVLNVYDLLVIDWLWFCNSPKVRIPGTEDMDKEYGDKMFHLRAFFRGLIIGLAISVLSAVIVMIMGTIEKSI